MSGASKPFYVGVFLVGAGKCGTTTISDWLFQHPQITRAREDPVARACLPRFAEDKQSLVFGLDKEPHIMLSRVGNADIDWCRATARIRGFNKKFTQKRFDAQLARCLPDAPQTRPRDWKTLAVDCSPAYFHTIGAAEAIKGLYPDAHILITLRHPTTWLYSYHFMRVRHGVKEPRFAVAYSCDKDHKSKTIKKVTRHDVSVFPACLAHWLDIFGRDSVKILILEEWRHQPIQAAQECYRFIGVDDAFTPKVGHFLPADDHRYPSNWLARQYYRLACFYARRRFSYHHQRVAMMIKLSQIGWRIGLYSRRPPMPDSIRRHMDDHFKPQVEAVEAILGREIPAWRRD